MMKKTNSEEKWHQLVEALAQGVLITNGDGVILYANEYAGNLFGQQSEQLVGSIFLYPLAADETQEIELLQTDGTVITAQMTVKKGAWHNLFAWIVSLEDISLYKENAARLKVISNGFDSAFEGIIITDEQGKIVDVNQSFMKMTGYSKKEVTGQFPQLFQTKQQSHKALWESLSKASHWSGELVERKKDGTQFPVFISITEIKNSDGDVVNYIGFFLDLTEIRSKEQQLERTKTQDLLTGLANKYFLTQSLRQLMMDTNITNNNLSIMRILVSDKSPKTPLLHLDSEFKDTIVLEMVKRLKKLIQEKDLFARIGISEFVIVIETNQKLAILNQLAKQLIIELVKPYRINKHTILVQVNIGIISYNRYCSFSAEELLNQADTARIAASHDAPNTYAYYNQDVEIQRLQFRRHLKEVQSAIHTNQLELFYQPKVSLETGLVIGVEALLRWRHPKRGILAPYEFLYQLDDQPISLELGSWVLNTVLKFSEQLIEQGLTLPISMNASSYQLQHPDFIKDLDHTLANYPTVPKSSIMYEVLETEAIRDLELVSNLIETCRARGILFALDDFGTGYSSLSYLKVLKTHQVKLDQSFIRNILTNPEDIVILKVTIELCSQLNRQLIAEGVESETHARLLEFLGCHLIQGCAIAKPMPANELIEWLNHFQLKRNKPEFTKKARNAMIKNILKHHNQIRVINDYLQLVDNASIKIAQKACPIEHWISHFSHEFKDINTLKKLSDLHNLVHQSAKDLILIAQSDQSSQAYQQLKDFDSLENLFLKEFYKAVFGGKTGI